MKTIHQLPQDIIAKIAAGEVIDRPAYAVKELIENAIDAKADYITIQIEEAGLKKIIVTDNGSGMSREDIEECFKPHTTSKISQIEQLLGITSLGFRGEALSSIAAISNMTIRSRRESETSGTEVVIKNGVVNKISPVGIPAGTTIIIEQLFHNVPVRKKFLKSQATEFRNIGEIVMQYALSFPNIRFFLNHNKKIILDLPKNQNILERIKMLLGNDIFSNLIPIEIADAYITINGFLSKPQLTTSTTNKQFIFVNNRRVQDKLISLALKEAYGNLLETHAYPVFILFLTLPFEMVDVNVHPKKEQVNFTNKQFIFETIKNAIRKTLEQKNITFRTIRWKQDPLYDEKTNNLYAPKKGLTNSFAGKILKDSVSSNLQISEIVKDAPIEQIHNLYLLVATKQGFIIIDQHAAHERVLFEKFTEEFKKQKRETKKYSLKTPINLSLSFSEAELLKENMQLLEEFGFSIDQSQEIKKIPEFLKDHNIEKLIHELLDELSEEKSINVIDTQSNKMLAYLACRSAIKAGETLTKKQMKELVTTLETTKNNATCPHGRPTKIAVSLSEINKLFKRK
jgi:DNA mismatch repair protein MutL